MNTRGVAAKTPNNQEGIMGRRHVVRIIMLGLLSFLLCGLAGPVRAGLWFTSDQRTNSIDVLFMVDGDTVTVVYSWEFTEDIADFVWIIPLPSQPLHYGPYLGKTPGGALFPITFDEPPRYCDSLFYPGMVPDRFGSGSAAMSANPKSEQVIDGKALDPWLAAHGYTVSAAVRDALTQYIQEGMVFLVLEMHTNGPYGGNQKYTATYKADRLTLPLRLVAAAAKPSTVITVWMLGNTRYVAQNTLNTMVDFSRLRAPSRSMEPFVQGLYFAKGENNYAQELSRAATISGTLAFVTEYAGSSAALVAEEYESGGGWGDLAARYPYTTRLYSEILPPQVTVDQIFVPAPDAPNISNHIDLKQYVDSLVYWGCSNREALQRVSTTALPNERDTVRGMNLAYPEKWVRSVFDFPMMGATANQQKTIYAFATRPVGKIDLQAYLEGIPAPPMFVAFETDMDTDNWDEDLSPVSDCYSCLYGRFVRRFRPMTSGKGMVFAVLTSDADWESNKAMYTAMLDYALALPYYLHPELRYTLFLDGKQIGLPEGWREHVEGTDVVIAPDQDGAEVRIRPVASLPGMPPKDEGWEPAWREKLVAVLVVEYDIPQAEQLRAAFRAGVTRYGPTAIKEIPAVDFERAGRKGYLRVDTYLHAVVELTAPASEFRQYEHILQVIRDSLRFSYPGIAFG
jgi:hypothetical protein